MVLLDIQFWKHCTRTEYEDVLIGQSFSMISMPTFQNFENFWFCCVSFFGFYYYFREVFSYHPVIPNLCMFGCLFLNLSQQMMATFCLEL